MASRFLLSTPKRSARAVANLQDRDINRAVARSSVLASRLWRLASNDLDPDLVQPCVNELVDLSAYAYLLRKKLTKRRFVASKRVILAPGIELASPVHDLAARAADSFDIDLGNVRKRFVPVSTRTINKTIKEIRSVMSRALATATREGLTTTDAKKFVLRAIRKRGIEPRSTAYIETLVRTHAAIAYGAAHRESFVHDLDIWGFGYYTVGDNRVREEHELMDGILRKFGDPFWDMFWPPNGWNCRCQAVAIYDHSTRQTRVPKGIRPDAGFEGDFSDLLAA